MVRYGQTLLLTLFIYLSQGFFSPTGIVRHAPWNLQSSVSSWWPWASFPSSLHAVLLGIPEYNGVLLQVFLRSGVWLPWLLHEQRRRKLLMVHVRWKSTAPLSLGKLLSYGGGVPPHTKVPLPFAWRGSLCRLHLLQGEYASSCPSGSSGNHDHLSGSWSFGPLRKDS